MSIPTWKFPRTGGLLGGNLEVDPAAREARIDKWAGHDLVVLYTGAWAVLRDVDERLRLRNPGIVTACYFQGLRALERASGYWPQPTPVVRLQEMDRQGWPGWDALDLRDPVTVASMVSIYRTWIEQFGIPGPYFFDELHADVTFERPELEGVDWCDGARTLLRKMGGGIVNGNFGRVTPNTPNGSWNSMIRGRMDQNAGGFTGAALMGEADMLAEEAGLCSPENRHFIVQDTDPANALKCCVLSLMCDGVYGITRADFRGDSLVECGIRRGALGRPIEYANGVSQVPVIHTTDANNMERRFENGTAWINEDDDSVVRFGVTLSGR